MPEINLDMDVLRTLITAQQLGGFNRAAKRVGRSQSAVSQQIRKLEEELGVTLLERTTHAVRPTPAGERLLADAEALLPAVDAAFARASEHGAGPYSIR